MAIVEFRLPPHSLREGQIIVEIWDGDEFIAAIYPAKRGVRLVSKFDLASGFDALWPGALSVEIGHEQAGPAATG